MAEHTLTLAQWDLDTLRTFAKDDSAQFNLSDEVKERIVKCRDYLDKKMETADATFYGINTGFGFLCNTRIENDQLTALQENLLRSHACGTGEEVPAGIVRLMMLLKVRSLGFGHSGVQLETVERLLRFLNIGVTPVVYTQGSLGASGDLAPLAHLCLPLIGEGEVVWRGTRLTAAELHHKLKLKPLKLKSKEGLALINGTQFMLAYLAHLCLESTKLWDRAHEIAAASLEAFDGCKDAFHPGIHRVRAHAGQVRSANHMRELLKDSRIFHASKTYVQDPYSFRCIPQVHGASYDVISRAAEILSTELNSTTDNPNIFPEEDLILSGGNFHGQPLALQLDFLAIGLAELGSISERRIYLLLSGTRDLPPFLARDPGLHSGLMIVQYTAAAIASENKQLCTPSSVDSITSSNGQEDHVSMGANAAVKCLRVLRNVQSILAMELLTASQALSFRPEGIVASATQKLLNGLHETVPSRQEDRYLHPEIEAAKLYLSSLE